VNNITKLIGLIALGILLYQFIPIGYRNKKVVKVGFVIFNAIGILSLAIDFYLGYFTNETFRNIIIYVSTIYFAFIIIANLASIVHYLLVYILIKLNMFKTTEFLSKDLVKTLFVFIYVMICLISGLYNSNKIYLKNYNINLLNNDKQMKVGFISDLHIGSGMNKDNLEDMVELINSQDVDILLIGGDVIDSTSNINDCNNLIASLNNTKTKNGIYYVYGNHEEDAIYDIDELLNKCNVNILNNDVVKLDDGLNLIGRKCYNNIDCQKIIEDHNLNIDDQYIILQHIPRQLDALININCLVLAGHTHGYRLNGTNLYPLANEVQYGYQKNNKAQTIVTSGPSGWGLHFSYPSKNEIVIINLTY